MNTLLIIAAFVLLAVLLAFGRQPGILAMVGITLWIAVPDIVTQQYGLLIHPAVFFLAGAAFSSAVQTGPAMARTFATLPLLWLGLAVFIVVGIAIAYVDGHGELLYEQVLAPLAIFVLVKAQLELNPRWRTVAVIWISALAAGEAILALAQQAQGNLFPYDEAMMANYWYIPGFNRYNGTTDQALVLAVLLTFAVWLLPYIRPALLRVPLACLYFAGIFAAQARTALICSAIGALAVLLASPMRAIFRVFLITALAATIPILVGGLSTSGLFLRLSTDDGGSSIARGSAVDLFFQHLPNYLVVGTGISSAKDAILGWGSSTSFENPYMSYVVDYGLPAATLFFGIQIALIVIAFWQRRLGFYTFAAIAVLITVQSFSSLEFFNVCGPLLWLALALMPAPTQTYLEKQIQQASTLLRAPATVNS